MTRSEVPIMACCDMNYDVLSLWNNHVVYLLDNREQTDAVKRLVTGRFATMFAANDDADICFALDIAPELIGWGCVEFCCVGQSAETLHDRLDELIETGNNLDIVTTFHEDGLDACEHFICVSGMFFDSLCAYVKRNKNISSMLCHMVAQCGDKI